jgi:DNA-binding IscR family transcriptional regulator
MSWQIVLFGAELAFSVQHYATYKMEQRSHLANLKARVILALSIISEAAQSLEKGRPPLDVTKYAVKNRVPVRFLNSVIDELVKTGYIGLLSDKDDRYVLLKSPAHIRVSDVINVMMSAGAGPNALGLSSVDAGIIKAAKRALGGVDASLDGVTIESLLTA